MERIERHSSEIPFSKSLEYLEDVSKLIASLVSTVFSKGGIRDKVSQVKEKTSEVKEVAPRLKETLAEKKRVTTAFLVLRLSHVVPSAILAAQAASIGIISLFGIQEPRIDLSIITMVRTGSLALCLVYQNQEGSAFFSNWDQAKGAKDQLAYIEEQLGDGLRSKKEIEVATSIEIVAKMIEIIDEKDTLTEEDLQKKLDEVHGKIKRQVLLNRLSLVSIGSMILSGGMGMINPQLSLSADIIAAIPLIISRTKEVLPEVDGAVDDSPKTWSDKEITTMQKRKSRVYRADLAMYGMFLATQAITLMGIDKLAPVIAGLSIGGTSVFALRTLYSQEVDRMLFDKQALKDKGEAPEDRLAAGWQGLKGYGSSAWTWVRSKVSSK